MTVNQERRSHPRVDLQGEANILLAGVVKNGTMTNLSQSGVQLECPHQMIEQLSKFKSNAGVFPDFELEFALPSDTSNKKIKSTCNVSYCRRQRQDSYLLGLTFISLDEQDEHQLAEFVNKANES